MIVTKGSQYSSTGAYKKAMAECPKPCWSKRERGPKFDSRRCPVISVFNYCLEAGDYAPTPTDCLEVNQHYFHELVLKEAPGSPQTSRDIFHSVHA